MNELDHRIAENLTRVREQIAAAAQDNGRPAEAVRLVAATKYVGIPETQALVGAGCRDLGESRPQDLWAKAAEIETDVQWHLIGHLQRNKVRRTLPLVALIHSVDSQRLLAALDQEAISQNLRVPILLEINVSGEAPKHGFAPDQLQPLLPTLTHYRGVQVRGLMCMAGLEGDADHARREFAQLRELRDRLRGDCPPGVALDELSMGMSGDFETAIREGATIVRVGSALFEGVAGFDHDRD